MYRCKLYWNLNWGSCGPMFNLFSAGEILTEMEDPAFLCQCRLLPTTDENLLEKVTAIYALSNVASGKTRRLVVIWSVSTSVRGCVCVRLLFGSFWVFSIHKRWRCKTLHVPVHVPAKLLWVTCTFLQAIPKSLQPWMVLQRRLLRALFWFGVVSEMIDTTVWSTVRQECSTHKDKTVTDIECFAWRELIIELGLAQR